MTELHSEEPPKGLPTDAELPAGVLPFTVSSASQPPSKLQTLGRRVSSRTTDLLAIAIVVTASLTIGRQMLQWWHDDPPAVLDMGPLENLSAEWGADSRPVTLEVGNSPLTMTRQVLLSGGRQAALDSVHQRCQDALNMANSPDIPADQSERDQLEAISKLTPDMEQAGSWQLFTIGGGLPTVVGVKTFGAGAGKSSATSPPQSRRVICWGLVFPGLSPGSWTAYTFVRKTGSSDHSTGASSAGLKLSQLELPANCQRTMLLQESGQSGLLGFQGTGQVDAWKKHFTTSLSAQGWTQSSEWQAYSGGWSNRFVQREPGRLEDSIIQVQFHQQQTDQGVGLIHWLPGRQPLPESAPAPTARGTP